jgi:hypothetical protein
MGRTAGGAAASAGIDFQHRVAALVMAYMIAGLKDFDALGLLRESDVRELQFESQAEIDDLVLVTQGRSIFVQTKRSLSFSDAIDSKFSSVLRQFVRQSLIGGNQNDAYVIATTPHASGRIIRDLRKLTDAVRFNETGSRKNPMTKLEQRVLATTRTLLAHHFEVEQGTRASEGWLDGVFARIYVAPLSVEKGGAHEATAFAWLAARSAIDYRTLWAFLLTLAMSLAARRLSIDRSALDQRVSHYLKQANDPARQTESRILKIQLITPLSVGREIVLVDAKEVPQIRPQEPVDYLVFELFRFNQDGNRRMEFREGKVHFLSGPVYEVLHRAATLTGMRRFVERDTRFARHGVVAAHYDFDPDDTPAARAFREYCEQRLTTAANLLECIACGDPISDDEVPLIEIDEAGHPHDIGHVHGRCLRPTHRVIGILDSALFRQYQHVRDFDYEGWFQLLQHGQEFSRAMGVPNQVMPLYWVRD